MTRLFKLSLIVAAGVSVLAQSQGLGIPRGVLPKDGFVPTEAVATAIAEAVLIPVYGKQTIASELPLNANLNGNIWTVTGSINCGGKPNSICPGGQPR